MYMEEFVVNSIETGNYSLGLMRIKHCFTRSTNSFFWTLFIVLCVFQDPIKLVFAPFSYFDELLAILGLLNLVINYKNLKKQTSQIRVLVLVYLIIGILSSEINRIQNITVWLSDAFLNIKFFLAIILGASLTTYIKPRKIAVFLEFVIIILALLTAISYVSSLFPAGGYRHGIKVLCLFFSHPSTLASACVTMIGFIFLFESDKSKIALFSIILIIMMILTMRTKAIAAAGVFLFFMMSRRRKSKNKISIWQIMFAGGLAIIIGWNQFYFYFLENASLARSALLLTSIQMAKDYFPFGAGFATFGSHLSAINYSPLYYQYGINNIYGLSPNYPNYISDSFYPMLLGQTGVFGIIAYICIMIQMFLLFSRKCKNSRYFYAFLLPFIYLIISGLGESAFVNSLAIPLAICMGYAYKLSERGYDS